MLTGMLRAFVNLREKTGENYQITQLDQLTMFDNAEFSSWSSPNGGDRAGTKGVLGRPCMRW
ncbi:hypothetical protein QZR43_06265, partial [Serratia marcescens]|uniref:hypothetical protein n=1 Tax=Serratia marcescens TaxID=615 RepID=UPI00275B5316